MENITVNWMARNLAFKFNPFGNHHYILIMTKRSNYQFPFPSVTYNGYVFITLGGFSVNGNMVFQYNNQSDVSSAFEVMQDPSSKNRLQFDWDTQKHRVHPLDGMNEEQFSKKVIELAQNYKRNTDKNPLEYGLFGDNCAAWVNTLFKVIGVPKLAREKLGQFWGIDAAERVEIPEHLFKANGASYLPAVRSYITR